MATSKLFDPKLFLDEYLKHAPEKGKALVELDYRQHEERLVAMLQSNLAVPKGLLTGGMRSGRSAAIEEFTRLAKDHKVKLLTPDEAGPIKGRRAEWMFLDEALPDVHPNCRCETVPVGADSRNVMTAHDDMLDALAHTMGLVRNPGETDEDFRTRAATLAGNGIKGTANDLVQAAQQISGVENVILNEVGQGKVLLHVCIDDERYSATEVLGIRDLVMMAVDEVRPWGVTVDYHWDGTRDIPSRLTEEERFIQRLKSKIMERYPGHGDK